MNNIYIRALVLLVTFLDKSFAFQWIKDTIVKAPPDKYGTYPSNWPTIKNFKMPIMSKSSSGPSFLAGQPSNDPGGYIRLVYEPTSTYNSQSGPAFNQYAYKFVDFLGYNFMGMGCSESQGQGYYNCSEYSPGLYFDSSFFSGYLAGARICDNCCTNYYGITPWFGLDVLNSNIVAIETAIYTGFCDVHGIYTQMYCAWITSYGWCSDNIVTRIDRKIVLPCFINQFYYLVENCPVYKSIGLYPWFQNYEPPLYVNAGTVADSIQADTLNFMNTYDNVCIPYSYYGYITTIISFNVKFSLTISVYMYATLNLLHL